MASDPIKKLAAELSKVIEEKNKHKTQPLTWKFAEDCFKIKKFWIYRLLEAVCLPSKFRFICRKRFYTR